MIILRAFNKRFNGSCYLSRENWQRMLQKVPPFFLSVTYWWNGIKGDSVSGFVIPGKYSFYLLPNNNSLVIKYWHFYSLYLRKTRAKFYRTFISTYITKSEIYNFADGTEMFERRILNALLFLPSLFVWNYTPFTCYSVAIEKLKAKNTRRKHKWYRLWWVHAII